MPIPVRWEPDWAPAGAPDDEGLAVVAPRPAKAFAGAGAGRSRWLAAAAVAVVALVAAAGALVLERTPVRGSPDVGAPPPSQAPAVSRPTPTTTTTAAPAPTTTLPPPPPKPAELVSTAGGTATYQLTSAKASIVVKATGPCWIEVRVHGSRGPVFYQGTLQPGGLSKVTGPAWIRLGDPVYARVAVNGSAMPIPGATRAVPLNLQFTLG